jgi:hypothetical protein
MPSPAPLPAADEAGQSLYGVIDVLRPDRIAGWVIDRRNARAAMDVEIRREGRLIATVKAARPRRDLEKAGVGTGRYGFALELDPPLEPGFEFTLAATAHAADGTVEPLRRAARVEPEPGRRLIERIFEEVRRGAAEPADIRALAERIEIAQARIEATLAAIEAPAAPPPQRGLRLLVGIALALATASLATGVASMLLP